MNAVLALILGAIVLIVGLVLAVKLLVLALVLFAGVMVYFGAERLIGRGRRPWLRTTLKI